MSNPKETKIVWSENSNIPIRSNTIGIKGTDNKLISLINGIVKHINPRNYKLGINSVSGLDLSTIRPKIGCVIVPLALISDL